MFFEHHVPKNYHFFAQLVQKWGPHETHPKEKNNLFIEITKLDHKLSKTFILSNYHMFWQMMFYNSSLFHSYTFYIQLVSTTIFCSGDI